MKTRGDCRHAARWNTPFDPCRTVPGDFHECRTRVVRTQMMSGDAPARLNRYCDGLVGHALDVAYKGSGGRFSMTLIVPDQVDGLDELVNSLTTEHLDGILRGFDPEQDMQLELPRFKVEDTTDLKVVLQAMGVNDLFDPLVAEFPGFAMRGDTSKESSTGIVPVKALALSVAVHKAFIDVNEEGTETAPPKDVRVTPGSFITDPHRFRVDRPFYFLIRCHNPEAIMFTGCRHRSIRFEKAQLSCKASSQTLRSVVPQENCEIVKSPCSTRSLQLQQTTQSIALVSVLLASNVYDSEHFPLLHLPKRQRHEDNTQTAPPRTSSKANKIYVAMKKTNRGKKLSSTSSRKVRVEATSAAYKTNPDVAESTVPTSSSELETLGCRSRRAARRNAKSNIDARKRMGNAFLPPCTNSLVAGTKSCPLPSSQAVPVENNPVCECVPVLQDWPTGIRRPHLTSVVECSWNNLKHLKADNNGRFVVMSSQKKQHAMRLAPCMTEILYYIAMSCAGRSVGVSGVTAQRDHTNLFITMTGCESTRTITRQKLEAIRQFSVPSVAACTTNYEQTRILRRNRSCRSREIREAFANHGTLQWALLLQSENDINGAMLQFAVDVYMELRAATGAATGDPCNVIFSPFAVQTVMAMMMALSGGTTAQQLAEALHLQNIRDEDFKLYMQRRACKITCLAGGFSYFCFNNKTQLITGRHVVPRTAPGHPLRTVTDSLLVEHRHVDFAQGDNNL
uniref:SeRPin family member n=1 Tax=Rhipicephalus microplus TaxID=6941 RepID=G0WS04_RHIMP|nr:SeRPin family member [Rhipicephalus microplus]